MRKYQPLRPTLYAEEIKALLARLSCDGAVDFGGEAERIALRCGMSPTTALKDFEKTSWRLWEPLASPRIYGAVQP